MSKQGWDMWNWVLHVAIMDLPVSLYALSVWRRATADHVLWKQTLGALMLNGVLINLVAELLLALRIGPHRAVFVTEIIGGLMLLIPILLLSIFGKRTSSRFTPMK